VISTYNDNANNITYTQSYEHATNAVFEAKVVALLCQYITYGLLYFKSRAVLYCNFASLLRNASASKSNTPSVDTTKGVKWRRWFSQGLQYFFFFSFSCRSRAFLGGKVVFPTTKIYVYLCVVVKIFKQNRLTQLPNLGFIKNFTNVARRKLA